MEWINEAKESLLLTGSGDGIVRVRAGLLQAGIYGPENMIPPRLVTALNAAPVSTYAVESLDSRIACRALDASLGGKEILPAAR